MLHTFSRSLLSPRVPTGSVTAAPAKNHSTVIRATVSGEMPSAVTFSRHGLGAKRPVEMRYRGVSQVGHPAKIDLRPKGSGLLAVATSFLFLAAPGWAQFTAVTPSQAPPVPGADHDYIHFLNETVNPANGSVSLRIKVPLPADRALSPSFAFGYDSNSAHHFNAGWGTGSEWNDDASYISQGGWTYEVPMLQFNYSVAYTGGSLGVICPYYNNFIVADMGGTPHEVGLQLPTEPSACGLSNPPSSVLAGTDYTLFATSTSPTALQSGVPPPPVTATDYDGTVYYFANIGTTIHPVGASASGLAILSNEYLPGPNMTLPTYVEDRNGNKLLFTDNGASGFSIQDDIGRTVLTTSGFGQSGDTVTVSGLPTPYKTTWTNEPYSFTMQKFETVSPAIINFSDPTLTCGTGGQSTATGPIFLSGSQPEITSLGLPNGQSYTFLYDPTYGEIQKITYPTGAYVRYEFGLTADYSSTSLFPPIPISGGLNGPGAGVDFGQISCETVEQSVVLQHRYVSFDGVNELLQQDFTYSTTLAQAIGNGDSSSDPFQTWTSKSTTVKTTDLKRNTVSTTTYNYGSSGPLANTLTTGSPQYFTGVYDALPLEQSVVTTDFSNNTLKSETESYSSVYLPPSDKKTTISGTAVSEVQTIYSNSNYTPTDTSSQYTDNPAAYMLPTDTCTYNGIGTSTPCATSSSLLRHAHYDYASPLTTPVGGIVADRPGDSIVYNGSGTRVAETDYTIDGVAMTSITAASHDDSNFSATYTTRGNVTKISDQCFISTVACSNSVRNYTYNQTGELATSTDADSNVTKYYYNDTFTDSTPSPITSGYLTQITYPPTNGVSHIDYFAYRYGDGKLSWSEDENLQTTHYIYNTPPSGCNYSDGFDRLSQITYPDNGKTTYCYDDAVPSLTASKVLNTSNALETSVTTLDGMGHVIQTQLTSDPYAPSGTDTVTTTYDGEGLAYSKSNPQWHTSSPSDGTTQFYYDALGRPIETVEQDGSNLQWCYNGAANYPSLTIYCNSMRLGSASVGSWVDSKDENGNHWQRIQDALGRLNEVMEPNGATTTPSMETDYGYNALDGLTSVAQWGGANGASGERTRSFSYDSLSRLVQAFNPEAGWVCYGTTGGSAANGSNCTEGYDGNGNLDYKTDARGITVNYGYDALNRVVSKTYSNDTSKTPVSCFQYDTSSVNGASGYLKGRLTNEWTAAAGSSCIAPPSGNYYALRSILGYDTMGRILNEQQCTPSKCSTSSGPAISYLYDLAGDNTSLTNSVGAVNGSGQPMPLQLTTGFDTAGHTNSVTSNWSAYPTNIYTLNNYGPVGPLNWSLGPVSPSPTLTVTQTFVKRLWVNSISASGQIP